MLGPAQTQIVASAAAHCAKAIKQVISRPLKAQVEKTLSGRQGPEEVYALLNEVALKASVKGKMNDSTVEALRTVQSAYHTVLDAWLATPSEKHRREIKALFDRGLHQVNSRRKKEG